MPHEELYLFDVDFAGRVVFVECIKRERFSETFTVNTSEGLKNTGLWNNILEIGREDAGKLFLFGLVYFAIIAFFERFRRLEWQPELYWPMWCSKGRWVLSRSKDAMFSNRRYICVVCRYSCETCVMCLQSSYKLGKEWRIAAFYYFCYTVSHYKTSYKGYLQMKKPGLIVQSKGKYWLSRIK